MTAQKSEAELQEAERQIEDQTRKIDYYISEYTIELLAQKMKCQDFVVPDYQREFTWEEERKWRFIESILMNLPIPFLFFWQIPETGKLEIIDGSQRLRTIEEFIYGDLVLGELDKLPAVSGFSFNDLSESRQRKFKNRSIRGIILNEHADSESRLELFDRINTGSKIANTAEIRRGTLQGPFMELIISLAQNDSFVELTPVSSKQVKQREREELVTRFFAYGDGLDEYVDEVSTFLYAYTKKMNGTFAQYPNLVSDYSSRFENMVKFVAEYFPYGFKRAANGKASPRARYEAISIGCYLALKESPDLKPDRNKIKKWLESEDFRKITGSDGANVTSKLLKRLTYVKDKLLES